MSGANSKDDNTTVLGLASAIISKINSLISSHNNNTSAHSDKESTSNKVTSWSSTVSDTKYASEKLVKDSLDAKQNTLVSGSTIKTINNQSLLGSGNISITGGNGGTSYDCLTDFSYDSVNDELVLEYCSGKLIDNISKTTSGLIDTYTITYTDASTYQFTVTNGTNGSGGSITVDSSWIANSTNPVESQLVKTALDSKQDVLTSGTNIKTINNTSLLGSGNINIAGGNGDVLDVSNFYIDTDEDEIVIVSGTGSGGGSTDIVTSWSNPLTQTKVPSEKLVKDSLDLKQDISTAFSGSYSDLTNKPSYTATVTSSTTGAYKIGSINISGTSVDIYGKDTDTHQSLSGYLQTSDVVDGLSSTSATAPLSAKQGKILDEKIGDILTIINGTGNN